MVLVRSLFFTWLLPGTIMVLLPYLDKNSSDERVGIVEFNLTTTNVVLA